MKLVINFYFLSISVQLYMFRESSARHQESFTVHTASSFCVCVCLRHCLAISFLQDSATDGHKHRNWRLYGRWGTPDHERLTLETCRVIQIQIENKNLSQVASVGPLIGIYEDARTGKHVELYTYR
jgi:hypothetical protein